MTLNIGDEVTIRGVIKCVGRSGLSFSISSAGRNFASPMIDTDFITSITQRELRIGDQIEKINDVIPNFRYTVLAIHGSGDWMRGDRSRRWVVAAYKDDAPVVFMKDQVRCVEVANVNA